MLMPKPSITPGVCTLVFVPVISWPSTSRWQTPLAGLPSPSNVPSKTSRYLRGNPVEPFTSTEVHLVNVAALVGSHGVVPVCAFVEATPSTLRRASLLRPLYSTFLLVAAYAPPPSATQSATKAITAPGDGRCLKSFLIQNHSLSYRRERSRDETA